MRNISVNSSIKNLISPLLENNGYELVKLEVKKKKKGFFVRIFVDRDSGVTIDDCVFLTHGITRILDSKAENILPDYTLEISSPGLDRPLFTEKDYLRFLGHRVKIKLREEILKNKTWEGILTEYRDGLVSLETPKGIIDLPFENISSAKLNPSWDELINKN